MKILIIGGTGLISTPLVRRLLERGDDVTLFNRGKTAAPEGVRQVGGDRIEYSIFESQMRELENFDCVVDMVGYAPTDGQSVVRAFAGRVQQFVFCSTVDVHQKPASRYPTREDEPYGALNDYARGKVAIEKTLMEASSSGAFELTILRPAHTYGDKGALIHAFGGGVWIDRLKKNLPIIVHGDGTSLWCQAHAEDVAAAFVAAIGNPQTFGKSYTVTNEEIFSWNALFQIAAEKMGAPTPQLVGIPTRVLKNWAPDWSGSLADNFWNHNIFDIRAAKTDLNYQITIPLREGARRFFAALDWERIESAQSKPLYDQLLRRWTRAMELSSDIL